MLASAHKKLMALTAKKQVKQTKLYFDILSSEARRALDYLSLKKWLRESRWYLAGGTALALQARNRQSIDLDFFTEDKEFNVKKLIARFVGEEGWHVSVEENNTIYGELFKVKVSFIAYPFFVPKQKPIFYGAIRILSPLDIAVMKIIAVSQRGRKRDFFDLF